MQDIIFSKFHGAGNDFILIDNRNNVFTEDVSIVKAMCDRHLGIGADGLMLLENADGFDFEMKYFNSDGHLSTFCGNGSRCIAAFAYKTGIAGKEMKFKAADGIHAAKILSADGNDFIVVMQMKNIEPPGKVGEFYFTDTGSPHVVSFINNVYETDVFNSGRYIRNLEAYRKEGVNVNFAGFMDGNLHVRTYERGVEDETLSCGTGVTASAISAAVKFSLKSPVNVITKGGHLSVHFTKDDNGKFTNIKLEGPAKLVFEGVYFMCR